VAGNEPGVEKLRAAGGLSTRGACWKGNLQFTNVLRAEIWQEAGVEGCQCQGVFSSELAEE